ncbi:MAG: HEPN domain-containing protein, partial [Thermoanaerobaculia bacterium]
YLVYNNKPFRKTHNLSEILNLCIEIEDDFKLLENEKIYELTIYSTELRYPEYFYIPNIEEAKEAILLAEKTKNFVLKKFKEKEMEFDKFIK